MLIISITEINCDCYLILCITENAKRDYGRSAKHEHVLIEMFLENIFCSEKIEVLSLLISEFIAIFCYSFWEDRYYFQLLYTIHLFAYWL